MRRLELAGAVPATGLQRDCFDCELSASRQGALGNNIEAKPQSVGLDPCADPDLKHHPGDRMQAFLAGAINDEVYNALAQRQFVHRLFIKE